MNVLGVRAFYSWFCRGEVEIHMLENATQFVFEVAVATGFDLFNSRLHGARDTI